MEQLTALKEKIIPTLISNRLLELIILPTEQCNFRCVYCYEDFSIGKMKRETIDGIKHLISKRAKELDILKLSWFGGEPLSAREIVYEISEHANDIAYQHGIKYVSNMTTNGFLLSEIVATKLYMLGIRDFQVSLDGPREVHNKTRLRINKTGSFDQIWENLLDLRNSTLLFSITLRIHVTPDNYQSLFILIEELKTYFGGDARFKVFFKAIADLGGPNAKQFSVLHRTVLPSMMQKLMDAVDNKLTITKLKNTTAPYVCYAAQANSFLIRADGTLGKCTVAMNDARNAIGRITKEGTLLFDNEKILPWVRGLKTLDAKTLGCPLYGMPK